MKSKNSFFRSGDTIHIMREKWNRNGLVTYREDYYDELTSTTWIDNNGYLLSKKLGLLHRYVMEKWYGKEMLDSMTKQGWVVDHMNNIGYDCRISNLEFLPRGNNVAKGQTLDVDAESLRMNIALTLCKDFTTGFYQIHIGCNDPIHVIDSNEQTSSRLAKLKLLYKCDYRIVVNDATQLLKQYELEGIIQINKLRCDDWKKETCEIIPLKENENNLPIIERNGKLYFNPGKGGFFHTLSVEEGWGKGQQ